MLSRLPFASLILTTGMLLSAGAGADSVSTGDISSPTLDEQTLPRPPLNDAAVETADPVSAGSALEQTVSQNVSSPAPGEQTPSGPTLNTTAVEAEPVSAGNALEQTVPQDVVSSALDEQILLDGTPNSTAVETASAHTAGTTGNPYGLAALWKQGDFIAKGTLMILFLMSMATWYILLTKLWSQTVLNRHAESMQNGFWQAGNLQEGVIALTEDNTYRGIVESGLAAAEHHEGKLTDQIDLRTWISMSLRRSVETISGNLQGGLALLATVGSTAPFIGLFGTVWGIYHALISIGVAGQASIDKVAGPVGEALIMTAIGLAVAVPAVLGYNWLVRRNKLILEQVRNFGDIIEAHLLSGLHHSGRLQTTVPAVRAAAG